MPIHNPKHLPLCRALAVEAMLGILARGDVLTRDAVVSWLEDVLDDHPEGPHLVARAAGLADRVIHGPLRIGADQMG